MGAEARTLRIAAIGGDGIGPEVVAASLPVLERAAHLHGARLNVETLDWGGERFLRTGRASPADAAEQVRAFDAVLFGAVGHPDVPDHQLVWDLIIRLRQELDLSVNARPIRSWPGVPTPVTDVEDVDFLIVRENTEGEYVGIGGRGHRGSDAEIAVEVAIHSRAAIRRAARYAFEQARQRGSSVQAVTKSNAMRYGYTLWDETVREVAEVFPDVAWEPVLVDAMAARMIERPRSLDVILASNLFGDILSDLGAVLAGGLGMAPSANIAPDQSVPGIFEPVHGSAPDIAGRGVANPVACILSGAMLLEQCGLPSAAAAMRDAVAAAVTYPAARTPDLGGTASTEALAGRVLDELMAAHSGAAVAGPIAP